MLRATETYPLCDLASLNLVSLCIKGAHTCHATPPATHTHTHTSIFLTYIYIYIYINKLYIYIYYVYIYIYKHVHGKYIDHDHMCMWIIHACFAIVNFALETDAQTKFHLELRLRPRLGTNKFSCSAGVWTSVETPGEFCRVVAFGNSPIQFLVSVRLLSYLLRIWRPRFPRPQSLSHQLGSQRFQPSFSVSRHLLQRV